MHAIKTASAAPHILLRDCSRAKRRYDKEASIRRAREIGGRGSGVIVAYSRASAGGLNGATLGRALSHDLPILPLRDLWLDNADVNVLLAADARASAWSKLALKPLFWGAAATGLLPSIKNSEVRRNLSLFVRSRWFKPPLDGTRMSALMLDAMTIMGQPARRQLIAAVRRSSISS